MPHLIQAVQCCILWVTDYDSLSVAKTQSFDTFFANGDSDVSGIVMLVTFLKLNSSDCRASKIISNDIKPELIPCESKMENTF